MSHQINTSRAARVIALRSRLYGTVYSRVARRMRVSRNAVRDVALGRRTSERIMQHLITEAGRIEARIERETQGNANAA